MYKQGIKEADLFLEEGTNRVPNDGKFHIIKNGKIIGSYKTLRKAQEAYLNILQNIEYTPQKSPSEDHSKPIEKLIDRYLSNRYVGINPNRFVQKRPQNKSFKA
ncbi:MAG: hypothetical protein AB1546_12025 [bacterium]